MVAQGIGSGFETVGKVNNYISMGIIVVLIISNILAIFATGSTGFKRTSTANFVVKTKTEKEIKGYFVHNGKQQEIVLSQKTVPTVIYYDPNNLANYSEYTTMSIVGGLSLLLLVLFCAFYLTRSCSNSEFCNQIVGARSVYKMVTH